MGDAHTDRAELVPYTFATWVFELHVAGIASEDEVVRGACEAITAAGDRDAGDAAGRTLVDRVRELVADNEPRTIENAARTLYGSRVATDLGAGDRAERTHRIRTFQFGRQLPWLARIWERAEGGPRPSWIVVERVTDVVTAMDPNPWNDEDEERHLPVGEFQALWELDGCTSVRVS